jgi:hypothetical protein
VPLSPKGGVAFFPTKSTTTDTAGTIVIRRPTGDPGNQDGPGAAPAPPGVTSATSAVDNPGN